MDDAGPVAAKCEDGVVVLSVRPNSTATRLGFQAGDVVVEVQGKKITSIADLDAVLQTRQRSWSISVKRGSQVLQLQVGG